MSNNIKEIMKFKQLHYLDCFMNNEKINDEYFC